MATNSATFGLPLGGLAAGLLGIGCQPRAVTGERTTGRALVEHDRPDRVSITGSVRAGWRSRAERPRPRARRQ